MIAVAVSAQIKTTAVCQTFIGCDFTLNPSDTPCGYCLMWVTHVKQELNNTPEFRDYLVDLAKSGCSLAGPMESECKNMITSYGVQVIQQLARLIDHVWTCSVDSAYCDPAMFN